MSRGVAGWEVRATKQIKPPEVLKATSCRSLPGERLVVDRQLCGLRGIVARLQHDYWFVFLDGRSMKILCMFMYVFIYLHANFSLVPPFGLRQACTHACIFDSAPVLYVPSLR